MNPQRVHYLDHAATTPLREDAFEVWVDATRILRETPGNPASIHVNGRAARRMLEDAREQVGRALGADRAEVIFTSGATESNALAIVGSVRALADTGTAPLVQVCPVDHPSTVEQRVMVEAAGGRWHRLAVNGDGIVDETSVDDDAAVVSVNLVASETGVVQPIAQLRTRLAPDVRLHVDASQALTTQEVDVHHSGIDLLSVAGHKIGAPTGIGALVVRRGLRVTSDRPGGGQESQVRSGTVDVAGALALAAALDGCVRERQATTAHLNTLRHHLISHLPDGVKPTLSPGVATAPSIVHLSIDTAHPEAILLSLDAAHIAASAGSACHAGVTRPSRALLAMGRSERQALGVLRVSLAASTTVDDIDALLAALPTAVEAARALDDLDTRRH